MSFNTLPKQKVVRALSDPQNRSMRAVMRVLELNQNSSSASTKLKRCAIENGIDLSRFTSGRKVDWSGHRFDKLTVIKQAARTVPKQRSWLCQCDCGKTTVCTTGVLLSNRIRHHCGCSQYYHGEAHFNWTGCGDISGRYWNQIKCNAQKRKLPFSVTIEYIWRLLKKQRGVCALSGVPIGRITASLDRIKPDKGYTVGNVQWVHKDVNRLKQNFSEETLFTLVKNIYEHRCSKIKGAGNKPGMAGI